MEEKEIEGRAKISNTLCAYFKTDKGKQHRKKLSECQKLRMNEYNNYLNIKNDGI